MLNPAEAERARKTWQQVRRIEREVPGCRSVWWGSHTGLWLALVRRDSALMLIESKTLGALAALLGWQEGAP